MSLYKPLEEEPNSFARATHGNRSHAQALMQKDLSGNNISENVVPYTAPHSIEQINEHAKKTQNVRDNERKEPLRNY